MKPIESPSGINLRPELPVAVRLSKRAGIVALIVVTAVVGLVVYGISTRKQQTAAAFERTDPTRLTAASDAGKLIAADVPARTIAGPPAPAAQNEQELRAPDQTRNRALGPAKPSFVRTPPPSPPAAPIVVPEISPEERARAAAYRQELEALSAPTATGGGFNSVGQSGANGLPTRQGDIEQMTALLQAMQGRGATRGGSIDLRAVAGSRPNASSSDDDGFADQNMQDQKLAFLSRGHGASSDNYSKASRVRPLSKFEIKAGWDIPAVLEQALNSDLPGEIRALVRENVYDTASGNYLLIPQGSRLVGTYDSRIAYAQDGVTVVWNRLIFPDGSSIDLAGMAGQDAQGRAGLRHDVDNHYWRLISYAVLTSGFSAAFQLSQSRRGGLLAYPSAGEIAGTAVGADLSRLGADVTRRNLNVQPTIKVPVGYRFNVRINRDLLFEGPYKPFRL